MKASLIRHCKLLLVDKCGNSFECLICFKSMQGVYSPRFRGSLIPSTCAISQLAPVDQIYMIRLIGQP